MNYQITVERVAGLVETRKDFRIHSEDDEKARKFARDIAKSCGCLAALVAVKIIK